MRLLQLNEAFLNLCVAFFFFLQLLAAFQSLFARDLRVTRVDELTEVRG